jgi:hypothetical protein
MARTKLWSYRYPYHYTVKARAPIDKRETTAKAKASSEGIAPSSLHYESFRGLVDNATSGKLKRSCQPGQRRRCRRARQPRKGP